MEQLGNVGSEVSRARELLCDAWLGGPEFGSTVEGLDAYVLHFAVAARLHR